MFLLHRAVQFASTPHIPQDLERVISPVNINIEHETDAPAAWGGPLPAGAPPTTPALPPGAMYHSHQGPHAGEARRGIPRPGSGPAAGAC